MLRIQNFEIARDRHAEILREAERARLARVNRQERQTDRRIALRLQTLFAR